LCDHAGVHFVVVSDCFDEVFQGFQRGQVREEEFVKSGVSYPPMETPIRWNLGMPRWVMRDLRSVARREAL
jgi:hypothetical protein